MQQFKSRSDELIVRLKRLARKHFRQADTRFTFKTMISFSRIVCASLNFAHFDEPYNLIHISRVRLEALSKKGVLRFDVGDW